MKAYHLESFKCIREVVSLNPPYPVLCFNPSKVSQQVSDFVKLFPGTVSWALKSNPHPEVLRAISLAGIKNFCAASPSEITQLRYQTPAAKIRYTNPVKAIEDIAFAYSVSGVKDFTIDHSFELLKIESVLSGLGLVDFSEVVLSVRFFTNSVCENRNYNFGKKFGSDVENARKLLLDCTKKGFRTSLAFHPGSQTISPESFSRHMEVAQYLIESTRSLGVKVEELNIGGGFPVHYEHSEPPLLTTFLKLIEEKSRGIDCPLHCEPGRYLVAESARLLTRINLLRSKENLLHINDGMYGSLMETKFVDFTPPVRAFSTNGEQLLSEGIHFKNYQIAGPTCDSLDLFDHKFFLPDSIQVGDYLEFGMMGAYSNATATRFNGISPAKLVLVERF